jgi:hypothetical protein
MRTLYKRGPRPARKKAARRGRRPGHDFIIARDGRIAALYLFFDPLVS